YAPRSRCAPSVKVHPVDITLPPPKTPKRWRVLSLSRLEQSIQARRFFNRNDFEHRFHSLDILHRAYACNGIYRQGPGSGSAIAWAGVLARAGLILLLLAAVERLLKGAAPLVPLLWNRCVFVARYFSIVPCGPLSMRVWWPFQKNRHCIP